VAAARALAGTDRSVAMIGAVGDDDLGAAARDALAAEEVRLHVEAVDEPTGVALITVDATGENQIAVAAGANLALRPEAVEQALRAERPGVVLASLEVAADAVLAAASYCASEGARFVLNPAPPSLRTRELLPFAACVTPNARERAAMGRVPDAVVVVETRGREGARIYRGGVATQVIPAPAVEVTDTTGAGDCFNGVLAAGVLDGLEIEVAARRAVAAAGLSVTEAGAREGMPTRAEIDEALG
jgi:ribokinase